MRLPRPDRMLTAWREFRERQIADLAESNRIHLEEPPPAPQAPPPAGAGHPVLTTVLGAAAPGPDVPSAPAGGSPTPPPTGPAGDPPPRRTAYGEVGRPLNRHSPFYLGFFGALGALVAIGLWHAFGQLATTLSILLVASFLTLALNPIVERLARAGLRRAAAVAVVFGALLVVFAVVMLIVIPPVATQGTELAQRAPEILRNALDIPWVHRLDNEHHVIATAQAEINRRLTDQNFIGAVLGGILGAGQLVLNGIFQTLTVLILTLYFLASFPTMKHGAFAMIPASRRARISALAEEIMRRTGLYAIGQVSIAALNACLSFVMMTVVGIPYPAVLAVAVGLLGLIPLVGATIGASVVGIVAFFHQPLLAVVVLVYYLVYQQIENYVIAPRVMKRTISVPGAVTIVAALAGGTLLGVVGALLAIPVAAGLLLLYDEVLLPRQDQA